MPPLLYSEIVEVVCFQNVCESSENFRDENFASVWSNPRAHRR